MTLQTMEWLGVKTKLAVDPILVHLAQGMVEFMLKVTL
jgi:hypothetical protein